MEPINVPFATTCLTWLSNHLPHGFLVFAICMLCLLIGTIVFLFVVIAFLLCTWGYVHLFTHLVSAIPRLIKRIARYILYMPIFHPSPVTRPPNDRSQISTGFKTTPPSNIPVKATPSPPASPVGHVRHRQVASKTNAAPRNHHTSHHNVNEARETSLHQYPAPKAPLNHPQTFVRHQDCLYARIHIPLGANIDDYFTHIPVPPALPTNIRVQVPPIPLPMQSPASPDTRSPQSTTRS